MAKIYTKIVVKICLVFAKTKAIFSLKNFRTFCFPEYSIVSLVFAFGISTSQLRNFAKFHKKFCILHFRIKSWKLHSIARNRSLVRLICSLKTKKGKILYKGQQYNILQFLKYMIKVSNCLSSVYVFVGDGNIFLSIS